MQECGEHSDGVTVLTEDTLNINFCNLVMPCDKVCDRNIEILTHDVTEHRVADWTDISFNSHTSEPIPVAQLSEWVCGRFLARVGSSNPTGGMDVCLL